MKLVSKVWNWKPLEGRKTYLTAVLLVIWSGLKAQGYIDEQTYQIGITILGALGIASLRSAL